ncbi:MAG: hypothetical protein CFE28_05980 [Alphaproteobacteria bacterium PA2]|nr:MAG: hypothetical protein CFE28_05980 [Alphaproteobacteria bacterium PA2]
MTENARAPLEDYRLPVKIKLALMWTALMFLYIYNDYFSLYLPGTIADMTAGRMGPLGPATPQILIGVSIMLATPSLMIVLSAVLPPVISRWLNVLLGGVYTAIQAMTFPGSPPFYQIVVALEVALTVAVIWTALRWPRTPN